MQKVNGDIEGCWDGVVRIIHKDKGKTIYMIANGDKNDTFLSLNDCLKEIGYDGEGVVIVIIDDQTSGKVYNYGNYGACWYEYGSTIGYA